MSEERITVYILDPKDRPYFKLEWVDPGSTKRCSKSTRTKDRKEAERQRADLEYELNNGKYAQASRVCKATFILGSNLLAWLKAAETKKADSLEPA